MPKPRAGESKNSYMRRCVPMVMEEGATRKQAVGKCMGMYKNMAKNHAKLVHIIANISGKHVRTDYLEGEEYIVAPVAMMVEGVHNGSQGKLLYENAELDRWTPSWNHKPIVVDHPESGPACTQSFLNTHKVGIILNTRFERRKQRAEAWFHKKRTAMIEPRIIDVLNKGNMMEVSTGLYVDLEGGPGTYHGERYKAKATNHKPDHLAILPDKVGACSIAKGAGLMQLNSRKESKIRRLIRDELKRNKSIKNRRRRHKEEEERSFVHNKKGKAMLKSKKRKFVDRLIENEQTQFEVKDRRWLLSLNSEQLKALEPKKPKFAFTTQEELDDAVEEGIASSLQDPKVRKKYLKAIKNAKEENEDEEEDEEEDDVVENEDTNNVDDLQACVVSYMKSEGCSKAEATAYCKKKMAKNESKPKNGKKHKSLNEFLKHDVPPELRPILNQAVATARREHERLVKLILKNENNTFDEEDLLAMDLQLLKGIAGLAATDEEDGGRSVSYFGASTGADMTDNEEGDEDEEVLDLPTYNTESFQRGKRKKKLVPAGHDEDDEDDE